MADPTAREGANGSAAPSRVDAEAALEGFVSRSSSIRGGAILGPAGLEAATGDRARWATAAESLFSAADSAAGERASHAHVATEDGEAYAVRLGQRSMVAVTDRFELASLILADMRSALREVA